MCLYDSICGCKKQSLMYGTMSKVHIHVIPFAVQLLLLATTSSRMGCSTLALVHTALTCEAYT